MVRFLMFAATLCLSSHARAEAVLRLPPLVEPGVPAALARGLPNIVDAELRRGGHRLLRESTEHAGLAVGACNGASCAQDALNDPNVELVVQMRLFSDAQGASCSLAFIDRAHVYARGAELTDQRHELVIRDLIAELDQDLRRGPGPFLQLSSVPDRAVIRLDGHVAGITPMLLRVLPGPHVVRVDAPGFQDYSTTLEVPSASNAVVDLGQIRLGRAPHDVLPTAPVRRPASRSADWALGGMLVAGGYGLGILSLLHLRAHASCDQDDCVPARRGAIEAALASTLVLGGVTWWLRAPLARRAAQRTMAAAYALTPSALALTFVGRF